MTGHDTEIEYWKQLYQLERTRRLAAEELLLIAQEQSMRLSGRPEMPAQLDWEFEPCPH